MLTFAEIREADGYLRAPRVERSEVRLLWHSDYWDGPRSGMLIYRGESCWYEVIAESEDESGDWYRRFVILRLSPDQLNEEKGWHQLFQEKHTDEEREPGAAIQPRERWQEFYSAYAKRTPPDFSKNEVLGWFAW